MKRIIGATILAFAFAGCGTLAGQPGYKLESEMVVSGGTLSTALEYREYQQGGGSWKIPAEYQRTEIDYVSRLDIIPDRKVLEKVAFVGGDLLPKLTGQEDKRIQSLHQLVEIADDYIQNGVARIKFLDEAITAISRDAPPDAYSEIHEKFYEESAQRLKLDMYLYEIIKQEVLKETFLKEGSDELEEIVEIRLEEEYYKDERGNHIILNFQKVAEFIRKELQSALNQYHTNVRELEYKAESIRFRIRALLYSEGQDPVAVKVTNYFDAEDPIVTKQPRVSFFMSERDHQRVNRGLSLARDTAKLIKAARANESEIQNGFFKLRNKLKAVADSAKAIRIKDIDDFINIATEILDSISKADAIENKAELGDLRKRVDRVRAVATGLKAGFTLIEDVNSLVTKAQNPDPADLLQALVALPNEMGNCLKGIIDIHAKFKTIQEEAKGLSSDTESIREEIESDSKASTQAQTLVDQVDQFLSASGNLLEKIMNYQIVVALLEQLTLTTQIKTITDAAASVNPHVRTLGVDQAVTGSIDLSHVPADNGDVIEVRAELVTGTGNDEEVREAVSRIFVVRRFYFHSRFSSHLIFVDRQGKGDNDDPDTDFDPAPSASWTLHYLPRVNSNNNFSRKSAKFWRFISPGFGLNVAALDFEDENFQIGIGSHVSLFTDLVTVGYGYNLNANDDPDYLFVGIGLLEALDGLGGLAGFQLPKWLKQ